MKKKIFITIFIFISIGLWAQNAFNSNGKRTGKWIGYYPDNTMRYEATFENGIPVGIEKRYTPKGDLAFIKNHYPQKERCYLEMYSNGEVIAQGIYESQRKDSIWEYLGSEGKVRLTESYDLGVLSGSSTAYYPSGNISQTINYEEGKKHGKWIKFFENGDTMSLANYDYGILHGSYLSFYPAGKIQFTGNYIEDLKDGDWIYYSEEGEVMKVLKYNKGEILNPEVLEESYERFIQEIEKNVGNMPDPALQ